jgi:adenine-specific DNA-methyltransferase
MNENTLQSKMPNTPDGQQERLQELKRLFPDLFDGEGQVKIDDLKQLTGEASHNKERYDFTWSGKRNAKQAAYSPTTAALTYDETRSVNPGQANGNLIIEGENLESLKCLLAAYRGAVKCIYIDPPYNTGKDFVYSDNYNEERKTYWEQTGGVEAGIKVDTNPDSDGRYHSNWLNMIYPRLLLARQLLKDNGVIFVSIDDNEAHNLRKVMDEVFGEENFLTQLIWKKAYGGGAKSKHSVVLHEYILMYVTLKESIGEIELPPNEDVLKYYKFKDSKFEQRGPFRKQPLATNSMDERPNLRFPIKFGAHEIWPEKQWQWSENRVERAIQNDELVFTQKPDGWTVDYKQYLKNETGEVRGSKLYSLLEGPYTQIGTAEIMEIFGEGKMFTFPKPSGLIKHILRCFEKDLIVMDFFSGSGVTAQAVLELNRQDNGTRQFILVQLPEQTKADSEAYKAGFKKYPTSPSSG